MMSESEQVLSDLRFDATTKSFGISYRDKKHHECPHVVKLSGGRSSAFMLAKLLKHKLLSKERGDVVVFNNTSAEHPATYEFVSMLKRYTEQRHDIPFFLIEYATYEDVSAGNWVRFPTFRLVNDKPQSDENEFGYCHDGKVFEELLSQTAFLPNRHRRVCTSSMKIKVTERFLSSWFACESHLEHLGHYGVESRMTDTGIYEAHIKNGGKTPKDILLKKRSFVRTRPVSRPALAFQDFTSVSLRNRTIESMEHASFGGTVDLRSKDNPVRFVSLVGLRADEPERLKKLNARICGKDGHEESQPVSERVYIPLADNGITKEDISTFWRDQCWDLNLASETHLSNCTYCFLKGSKILHAIATELKLASNSNEFTNTPQDIQWWERIENEYGRDLIAEKRRKTNDNATISFIGFFGENSKFSYEGLRKHVSGEIDFADGIADESAILACNCTD